MIQYRARPSRLWLSNLPWFASSAAAARVPELGAWLTAGPGWLSIPRLSPFPSRGKQQAMSGCWGCHLWFSLAPGDRCVWQANILHCLLHRWTCRHLTEFQPFTPIKEGNNNAVLFSPGLSICYLWLCPKWIKKSICSLSASVKSNLFTVSAE